MPADDRLRELFDQAVTAPEPTAAQEQTARAALRAAIAHRSPRLRRVPRPAIAWGAAAVAAAVVVAVLVVPTTSRPVDANLADIARAARQVGEEQLPPGSYEYTHRDSSFLLSYDASGRIVSYLLPESVDIWSSGTSQRIVTTIGRPVFFDPADEADYYAAGLDRQDLVGETTTRDLTDIPNVVDPRAWSRNRNELRSQIESDVGGEDPVATLDLIAQLLDPTVNAPPGLRASLVELLGELDVVVERMPAGGAVVRLSYEGDFGSTRQELELDSAGYLVARRLVVLEPAPGLAIPAGTTVEESAWSGPIRVSGPGVLPD